MYDVRRATQAPTSNIAHRTPHVRLVVLLLHVAHGGGVVAAAGGERERDDEEGGEEQALHQNERKVGVRPGARGAGHGQGSTPAAPGVIGNSGIAGAGTGRGRSVPVCGAACRGCRTGPAIFSAQPRLSVQALLGIDIGGSGIKGALVEPATGRLLTPRTRLDTPQPATPAAVASTVAKLAAQIGGEGPIGAAFPARIRRGVALTASNIDQAFIGTDVDALLTEATGRPVSVLNDADAAGLGEVQFGAAQGAMGVVLLLTFGTGIGSGLFVDGRLVPNTELGHLVLPGGKVAEPFASDKARKEGKLSWQEWAERVQSYLDYVEFLFAPDLIVVGGGVSKPERWAAFAPFLKTQARLVPAALRNEAGIVGAAAHAQSQGA